MSHNNNPFCQLNTSPSKMKYTFPKATRFTPPTQLNDKYYNLPPLFGSGRKTSIGYGKKTEIGGRVDMPCPSATKYDVGGRRGDQGIRFGLGREEMKCGGIFRGEKTPGPGSYTIPSLIKERPEISFKAKLKNVLDSNVLDPGPGTYQIPTYLNKNGKYSLSHLRNNSVSDFSEHKTLSKKKHKILPGPGTYNVKENLFGKSLFNSKFHTSHTQTFCKVERKVFADAENTLGPGSYNQYSQFDP